jgi:hypothetical protein
MIEATEACTITLLTSGTGAGRRNDAWLDRCVVRTISHARGLSSIRFSRYPPALDRNATKMKHWERA